MQNILILSYVTHHQILFLCANVIFCEISHIIIITSPSLIINGSTHIDSFHHSYAIVSKHIQYYIYGSITLYFNK